MTSATRTEKAATGRSPLAGDVSGGLSSAIVSLVGNVAAGVIAFGPLGPRYAGQAILAGMLASIVAALVASLLGRTPGMILGPKASTSVVVASLVGQLVAAGGFDLSVAEQARVVMALAFTAVMISGAVQVALGAFRVGGIVTFIPYPVISGIRNAAALQLVLSQIWPFFGIERSALWEFPLRLAETQPATLAVAALTALLIWRGDRIMPKAIVPAGALAAGALAHQLFARLPLGLEVGPVLGALPQAIPAPRFLPDLVGVFTSSDTLSLMPIVLTGALAIAVLDSITSLISMVSFQSLAEKRYDGNRHLLGMGAGNMAVAAFGGLSASAIFARGAVNHRAGGRTIWSGVANSLWVLVLLLVLAVPIGFVPDAALAGLILVVAVGMLDEWSLELVREAVDRKKKKRQDLWFNLVEMLLVVAVGLVFNLIWAVGAGVAISILTFVVQMSRSPIRRVRRGATLRSKRRRDEHLMELLHDHGDRIGVIELEGTVFFGSSDAVARAIEELAHGGARYVIVDLKHVRRIDATGYKVLGQTWERLTRNGVLAAFSDVGPAGEGELREGLMVTGGVGEDALFASTDHALERFEDALLEDLDADAVARDRWSIADFATGLGLAGDEHALFAATLHERSYGRNDLVCARGGPGDSVFFLATGSADVSIPIEGRGRSRRLATFTRGTVFGEMSLLDGRPRSADVRACEDLICYELTTEAFYALANRHPETAMKIFAAIGRILGQRLREANELIQDLDV